MNAQAQNFVLPDLFKIIILALIEHFKNIIEYLVIICAKCQCLNCFGKLEKSCAILKLVNQLLFNCAQQDKKRFLPPPKNI